MELLYPELERFLVNQGYWFRRACTIVLTKADRDAINEPYLADPIIQVLGYSPHSNELLWIEPLTKRGIATVAAFTGKDDEGASRYKLFTDQPYRELLSRRLSEQMLKAELVQPGVVIRHGLLSHIDATSLDELQRLFQENNWVLLDYHNNRGWEQEWKL